MRGRLAALILAASVAAFGADREFESIVKGIESHYGTHRMHVPLLGVANLLVKVGSPAGASGFKLAVFQDLDSCRDYGDQGDLERLMKGLATGGLHPLLRVLSRSNGRSTYILTGEAGKSTRMLVATFDPRGATVVEVKLDMDALLSMIATPERAGEAFAVKDAWWDQ